MRFLILFFILFTGSVTHAGERAVIEAAKAVEAQYGGRVGVHVAFADSSTWSYRAGERFPMMSTFKMLLCAAALSKSDDGKLDLDRKVLVEHSDIVTYSPVFKRLVGQQVSLFKACDATMITSDNAAANIMLKALGGPAAVTAFAREIGDKTTRLDRYELELNSAIEGDLRDTTTPRAYVETLNKLILGDVLTKRSREQLKSWMVSNTVTGALIRKHLPEGWIIADRSGAGENGSRGIIAVIWPPEKEPFIVAIYMTNTSASFKQRNEAIAIIGTELFKR